MKNIPNATHKFRFWCQKVLPLVYDDSLSYYEVLCKVVDYINKLGNDIVNLANSIKDYVYDWLDEHPEATTTVQDGSITMVKLSENLANRINESVRSFETCADMKNDSTLEVGMTVNTIGYYTKNDGGSALYKILASESDKYCESLNNGLYAELIYNDVINPVQIGAILNASTDCTTKVAEALSYASIIFPSGCELKLNNLYIPDFREIDFNGAFVYTDHYAVVCGATQAHGYVRNITIKNAHFNVPEIGGAGLHSYGGVYLEGAIKSRIINCELANPFSGSELAILRNCFNCTIENCYAGTGNSLTYSNSCGVVMYAGEPIISGSDNLTNNDIVNCLFQHLTYGILIESGGGLIDTCMIKNVGFSYIDTGIRIIGGVNRTRNVHIDTVRVEFSDIAIYNDGRVNISDIYMTRIGVCGIQNTGYLTVAGEFAFYNPDVEKPAYINSGKINSIGCMPNLIGNGTIENTGYITKPYLRGENDSNEFAVNKIIHTVTGTSGESGGTITLNYPDGFDRSNSMVIGKQLYRSNYTWQTSDTIINVMLTASGINVITPTDDSTTFSRPIEVHIINKSW